MSVHVPISPPDEVNADWLAGLSVLGWRGIVLILAVLLGVYVLLAFFRLRRIGRARMEPAHRTGPDDAGRDPMPAAALPEASPRRPTIDDEPHWTQAPPVNPDRRRLEIVESEVVAMRSQIEALRQMIESLELALREEIARNVPSPAVEAPAARRAPAYGDAMQLAMGGLDAVAISERCDIARAEAELVVALARQSRPGGEGDRNGGPDRY